MKHVKKFNEEIQPIEQTLSDLIGHLSESNRRGVSQTDKGVFTNYALEDLEEWSKGRIRMSNQYQKNKDIYDIYIMNNPTRPGSNKNFQEFGHLLMKDNKPYILSSIPGDNYGAIVFNNTFISSGHDGFHAFNISNPMEYMSHLK